MNKDDLLTLLTFLKNVRNFESTADMMMQEECDKLIELVEKDIPEDCHHCDEPMPNGRCWWCGGPNKSRGEYEQR